MRPWATVGFAEDEAVEAARLAPEGRREFAMIRGGVMPGDTVERMIAAALAGRAADEPFHWTAARIFALTADDLTDAEKAAFEVTGFEAVKKDGPPAEIKVPSVVRLIEAGRSYDVAGIDPEERPTLMLLGFIALADEQANGGAGAG